MSRLAYLIGAGEMDDAVLRIPEGTLVIAADAGFLQLKKRGYHPDLVVGDFDSLGEAPEGEQLIRHSPEKDDTDMFLAAQEALAREARNMVIYGGLGGRPDHEYANLQLLAFLATCGARGFLVGRGWVWTSIQSTGLDFDAAQRGMISVFAHGGAAEGVTISGLRYPLEDYRLCPELPLGVSNEFIGQSASVSVRDGVLLVGWECPGDFEPGAFAL